MENVLCVSKKDFFSKGIWSGFYDLGDSFEYIKSLLSKSQLLPRADVENNFEYLQFGLQAVIKHNDKLMICTRRPKNTENYDNRANGEINASIGGHANEKAIDGLKTLEKGVLREIEEEIRRVKIKNISFKGIVYVDNGNPAYKVHFAPFWLIEVNHEFSKIPEPGIKFLGWESVESLSSGKLSLSDWSREFIRRL